MEVRRQLDEAQEENREFLKQFSISADVRFAFMGYLRKDSMVFTEHWLVTAPGQRLKHGSDLVASLERRISRYLKVNQIFADAANIHPLEENKAIWIHSGDECIGIGEARGKLVPIISFSRGDDEAPQRQAIFKMGLTYVVQALDKQLDMSFDWYDDIIKTALPMISVEFVVLNKRGEIVHEVRGSMPTDGGFLGSQSRLAEQLAAIKYSGKTEFMDAVSAATSREKKTTLVPIVDDMNSPRWVLVTPLENSLPDHALVIFDSDQTDHSWLLEQMFDIYSLTPSERNVAQGIIFGQTVTEIAEDTGLSVATVRSYVKQVLSKMGLHRQSELIQLYHAAKLPIIRTSELHHPLTRGPV